MHINLYKKYVSIRVDHYSHFSATMETKIIKTKHGNKFMQLYTYVFADTNNENMYGMILVFVITKY